MKKATGITFFISVLFVMFVGFSVNQWYPEPGYPDCNKYEVVPIEEKGDIGSRNPCEDVWGAYELQREAYSKQVSIILFVIGFAAVYFGIKSRKFEQYIHIGIMWGGIVTVLYGVVAYWNYFDDNLKPLLIGGLLVGVIYFGNKYKRYLK